MEKTIEKIIAAIKKNGYSVDPYKDLAVIGRDSFGILGRQNVPDDKTGREKYLLYTRGSEYEKGYLTGLLNEPAVKKMAVDYVDNVIWDFITEGAFKTKWWKSALGKIMALCIYLASLKMKRDIPHRFKKEMDGIYKGCKTVNKKTRVRKWRLWVLNTGIDAILSILYPGKLGLFRIFKHTKKRQLKIPVMCHGFALSAKLTEKGNMLFGRNFMFPTAGVFQLYASQVVHEQTGDSGQTCFTGVGAPGFVGLMTGMNRHGLGMGVNMVSGYNCNPFRPGLNSLLMVRLCIDSAASTGDAAELIVRTRRGVSWLYLLADAKSGQSCVVEAGRTRRRGNFLARIPSAYRKILPDRRWINEHLSTAFRKGVMIRSQGYEPSGAYLTLNKTLFEYYKAKHSKYKYTYNAADFSTDGMLDKTWRDKNCPEARYFPPQREHLKNMLLVSNMYMIPEMRLYSMAGFTNWLSRKYQDDFQWRYDMLNRLLLEEIAAGKVRFARAREMINFISPLSVFADRNDHYYTDREKYNREDHIPIEGSVSICNLDTLYMETLTGYYEDRWVRLQLADFL
ncbi:MAG: hypothetical protein JW874_11300 [Spirochaetales bacterium]|nr:hypothetical protein [Spirochaetales bacterium]